MTPFSLRGKCKDEGKTDETQIKEKYQTAWKSVAL
jgi:hypothetical protein